MNEECDNIRNLSKIINNVFSFLTLQEIKIFSYVNKYCHKMSRDYMINNFFYRYYGQELPVDVKNLIVTDYDYEKLPNVEKVIFHKSYRDRRLTITEKITHVEINSDLQENTEIKLPKCSSYLKLPRNIDKINIINVLSNSLTHLILHSHSIFNSSIEDLLPNSLQVLDLGFRFNQPIFSGKKSFLPSNLVKLIFSFDWNHPIHDDEQGYLPPKLKYLSFGFSFDNTISVRRKSFLPETLTYLDLGTKFNCSIDPLPNSLLTLKVSSHFERQIFSLPPKLVNLELKCYYKHNLRRGVIPNSLRNLTVYKFDCVLNEFNLGKINSLTIQKIDNYIHTITPPETVTRLVIFSIVSIEYLPPCLTYLVFYPSSVDQINMIPDSVKYLRINITKKVNGTVNKLPSSLEKLTLISSSLIDFSKALCRCQNLIYLQGNLFVNIDERYYPPNLKVLYITEINSIKHIPRTLTHITSEFEAINPGELPPNLISLTIKRCKFNQEILPGTFPESLQRLTISSEFNHVLNKENLPKKLLSLSLGQEFNQDLNDLPDSLMELNLCSDYNRPLTNLPKSLYRLRLNSKNYEGINFDVPIVEDLDEKIFEDVSSWTP